MLINFLSTVYWSRALKYIILYAVVVLLVIALLLLVLELTLRRHDGYLNKKRGFSRLFSFKTKKENYLSVIGKKRTLLHDNNKKYLEDEEVNDSSNEK